VRSALARTLHVAEPPDGLNRYNGMTMQSDSCRHGHLPRSRLRPLQSLSRGLDLQLAARQPKLSAVLCASRVRLCDPPGRRHADGMTERDDFLNWVRTSMCEAELALHNGDASARRALWSRNDPVSVLGAWRSANGQRELDDLFTGLERSFSDCTSFAFELQAWDVVGDMAYTAGLERTSASIDGQPRSYTLRATQVYRREDGEWRVAHRHADTVSA
jgi:ketosteroid isomerase-like protein